jgi:hypothetical protein
MTPEASAMLAAYRRSHGADVEAWSYTLTLKWPRPGGSAVHSEQYQYTGVVFLRPGFQRDVLRDEVAAGTPVPGNCEGPPEVLEFTLEPAQ